MVVVEVVVDHRPTTLGRLRSFFTSCMQCNLTMFKVGAVNWPWTSKGQGRLLFYSILHLHLHSSSGGLLSPLRLKRRVVKYCSKSNIVMRRAYISRLLQ